MRETSQNAISSLLQPPIVRTGLLPHTQASAAGFKAPTTKDIPPVTLTNIPHVPPEAFRDYLSRIGPLFESFQRGRQEPELQAAPFLKKDKELEKTDRFAEALENQLGRSGSASPTLRRQDSSIFSPAETPGGPRRRSSAQGRRNRNEPTPLSTIPNVYFDEEFHLENPRTFDVVSERAEIVRPPPGTPTTEQKGVPTRKALATNAILQEKLSWYMDTVEVHLINSISSASTSFFAALGSLKELQTEAEESVAKIQGLRDDLRRLDKEVALGGLEVAAKRRRRANIGKLSHATMQVQRVVEDVRKCDEMVDEGQYDEAADQMDQIGRLIYGVSKPATAETDEQVDEGLIDLRGLKALQGLSSGMEQLQYRIGLGYSHRFTMTLLSDLRQHVEKVPQRDTLRRWSRQRGVPPTYMEASETLREELLASLNGLARCGQTAPATAAFREAVMKEMKSLIRKHLPSSNDDDADSMVSSSTRGGKQLSQQEKSTILARNLRALDAEEAEKLLVLVYTSVSEALRRLSTQVKVLLDVTSSMSSPEARSPSKSQTGEGRSSMEGQLTNGTSTVPHRINVQDELIQALDMSSLLGQAVDTAQTQITRVLKVRSEQSIRTPKDRFLRYFTLHRLFADECEAISGRSGQALKGIINAQISGFVQVLGQSETEEVAQILDSDAWEAKDFTAANDAVLKRILDSMGSDPAIWTQGAAIWEDVSTPKPPETNGVSATNGSPTPTQNGKAQVKPAYVDEQRYILVASAISLLSTMDAFLSLTASIPSMTPAISTSLLDVLRTFNSRSCQLILGAGATRSAGLKNITTKHLALASQALSFVIALIPYMRECVRRHLAAGQLNVLAEFDKTKRLYQDHQSGIHDKLVEIMTSRSSAHVKAMMNIDFDAQSADADKASPYMETLTKETATLHRVLSRHLSEADVGMIMRLIFQSYKEQWSKAFGSVDVSSEAGEERLLRDAELFDARLGKIEGFGNTGKEMINIVKAKSSDDVGGKEKPSGKVEGNN